MPRNNFDRIGSYNRGNQQSNYDENDRNAVGRGYFDRRNDRDQVNGTTNQTNSQNANQQNQQTSNPQNANQQNQQISNLQNANQQNQQVNNSQNSQNSNQQNQQISNLQNANQQNQQVNNSQNTKQARGQGLTSGHANYAEHSQGLQNRIKAHQSATIGQQQTALRQGGSSLMDVNSIEDDDYEITHHLREHSLLQEQHANLKLLQQLVLQKQLLEKLQENERLLNPPQPQLALVQVQPPPILVQEQPVMIQQQPVMVQQQPVMVQRQPVMVQHQPVMVQQQQPVMVQQYLPQILHQQPIQQFLQQQIPQKNTIYDVHPPHPHQSYIRRPAQQQIPIQQHSVRQQIMQSPVRFRSVSPHPPLQQQPVATVQFQNTPYNQPQQVPLRELSPVQQVEALNNLLDYRTPQKLRLNQQIMMSDDYFYQQLIKSPPLQQQQQYVQYPVPQLQIIPPQYQQGNEMYPNIFNTNSSPNIFNPNSSPERPFDYYKQVYLPSTNNPYQNNKENLIGTRKKKQPQNSMSNSKDMYENIKNKLDKQVKDTQNILDKKVNNIINQQ